MIDDLDWVRDLRAIGLRVRRSWPRSSEHLLLEVADESGRTTAGQWFADPERAERVADRTPGCRRHGAVVLQPCGADRRLTALSELLGRPGHHLIGHRPERRAVVHAPAAFVKVVRPDRHAEVVRRARVAERCDLGAPRVLEHDPRSGTVVMSVLPGVSLTDLLTGARAADACRAAGRALAALHAVPVDRARTSLKEHRGEDELAVLRRWTDLAEAYGLLDEGVGRVPDLCPSGRRTLVHRDLHDGQLMIDDERVGVLDFDLLTVGDPALDLANLIAHLELRSAQGLLGDASVAIAATMEGYRPTADVRAALPGYRAASQERLRAVYAFRDPRLVS